MPFVRKASLLAATAIVALCVGPHVVATQTNDSVAELLDPKNVIASICESPAAGRNELFKPGLRLALVRQAQAALPQSADVPLWEGLGDLHMDITAANSDAKAYFLQGLRLTMAFNHAEATRSFRAGQDADPSCAMCYWGEAFVLGPNINDGMHDENIRPAFAAASQAVALQANTTELEQALIGALAQRYAVGNDVDRVALDLAFADAMSEVAAQFPEEPTVLSLTADAIMNTQPWDYWEADGTTPRGRGGEIVGHLERALELDPKHAGAAHLYIHAVEASKTPERAEAFADMLGAQMPAAGHLVHMPSHIYYRIGRYLDSLEANRAAVAADEAFFAQVQDEAIYRYGYYPHNVHFLLVSAQMAGVAEDALAAAEKLGAVMSDDLAEQVAWIQAIKTAPYTAHAQFSDADTILAIPEPSDRFPFVTAFWHYSQAIGHLKAGDTNAAAEQAKTIQGIVDGTDLSALEDGFVPATDLLTIAHKVITGRIAAADGRLDEAEALLREAVALQDTIPYMEPPYWYYPVRQTLARVLHEAGKLDDAEQVWRESLIDAPNNGWALYGLHKTLEEKGDAAGAEAVSGLFEQAWAGDMALLEASSL